MVVLHSEAGGTTPASRRHLLESRRRSCFSGEPGLCKFEGDVAPRAAGFIIRERNVVVVLNRDVIEKEGGMMWDEPDASPETPFKKLRRIRLKLHDVLVCTCIVGGLVGLCLPIGDRDYKHRYPSPDPSGGNALADLAGEYDQGAIRGRLSILADGRYSFLRAGCFGVHDRESGFVTRAGKRLTLTPAKPIEQPMERDFIPIHWGRRIYLIGAEKLQDFCEAIIQGDEPRVESPGSFYLRGVDDQVDGAPELPEEWAAYLRNSLVLGTIIAVLPDSRARLDVGLAQGVGVGSVLAVQGRGRSRFSKRWLRVVSVEADSCNVQDAGPDVFQEPLEIGWRVVVQRGAEVDPSR